MRKHNPGSFYGSFCEGYRHFWLILGKISEELSGETVEKVTKSKMKSHMVLWVVELMRFIVTYMNMFRPTDPLFPRELVNQLAWP